MKGLIDESIEANLKTLELEPNFAVAHNNLAIAYLEKGDLIVGFNIKRFDYGVLGAYTESDLLQLTTFDILEDIYRRLGFRLGLDHLATETLQRGKTAHGLQAVEWFRQGEMKKLIDYCYNF